MSSSQSSSRSLAEEDYYTAEEDHLSHAQRSSGASSTVTTTPDGSSDSVYATANQTPIASPDISNYTALSIPIAAQYPGSPTAIALDKSSRLWPPKAAPQMNDGQPASLADTFQSNYLDHREASDFSYTNRPAPIDPSPQQTFLSSPLPFNNNTCPLVSNHITDTHQGLPNIEESEMPYEYPSGMFIMNPEAPVFVPRQERRPAMRARNPHDCVYYGAPQPKPGQVAAAVPTNTPTVAAPVPRVQLYGSGHGMFFDPNTGMFTGDGAPRKSPYRADGTLPSKPDLQNDSITNRQYPEPAEDMLHIQTKREVAKRMADFGRNGPIQKFRVKRPMPQEYQQGTRVMVEKEGQGREILGRRAPTAEEMEGKGSGPSRPVYITDEMEANLKRLMGITGEEEEKEGLKEKEVGAEEGEEGEEKKEFEGTGVQDSAVHEGKGRYAGPF